MKHSTASRESELTTVCRRYEAPALTLVGDAIEVVMGLPGDGWDGPHGLSRPDFEFEMDDDQ
jgi:hypothetical protein